MYQTIIFYSYLLLRMVILLENKQAPVHFLAGVASYVE